jgi:putative flippase GtrA
MQTEPQHLGGKTREAFIFAKASISSAIATACDGVVYQMVLFAIPGRYVPAAFLGALLGAVTNFTLNRYWAFPKTWKTLRGQAGLYAFASLVTYGGLQSALWLLIEVMHMHERTAWLPAKAFAWLLLSYPLQRFLVFGKGMPGRRAT